ncbi:energy transducer TonB [Yersinia kristensenii]|uniref:energy transducer TonB family protein n=1 Tax=Yersinia kristensenii TaxID=28152 RepID=UPI001C61052D|nr:energy transducer TonB [Yersinia kristensenii]MBW5813751.1 energy transducer TonB [Yersinia kristensenii]MBW5817008.1 energy transducer TonB [Yersinia kristensenii]MBW5827576.1 energy transducer TonB [Yersinia kristensenii]MBW5830939.1 energy transducer TonB [Yersinia kristensenii]MBW5842580.1 energy transducer TonB [Yersinia kristensenii]
MKKRQDSGNMMLWWGSILFTSCIHVSLIWLLSNTFMLPPSTEVSPVAMMLALSTEPEFTQNLEQDPVVGITQNINEPIVEQLENQPEDISDMLTAPEHSNASLIVERKVETAKKEPTKVKRLQQKVMTPRQPISEPISESPSKPSAPAVATSTPLSGESHQVAAVANSDSAHNQKSKMNWKSRLQGHLAGFKRYPLSAKKQRQQGTASIRFVVNTEGYVLSAKLIKSSGIAALDQESLAMIKRAQPLPQPPAGLLSNGQVTLTMPIGFELKNKRW